MKKRILSVTLSIIMILGLCVFATGCGGPAEMPETSEYKLAENVGDGSILHCFSWDFETIKNSMADIAAAGFTSLQTSPINECLEGEDGGMQLYGMGKWYYHYQPTDWTIGNYQLGTKEQFKEMCDEADKYGIKVIVDVIPNHTTPTTTEINQNLIDAVGGMDKLFHENSQYDLKNYGNRLECTTYKMGGLPDVNTENPAFQDYFLKYINECIDLGADGFRYDTAKHIGLPDDPKEDDGYTNNFWERVTTEIHNADTIFNYGEVLQGNNDRIKDYINAIGRTTASTYGSRIRNAVVQENLDSSMIKDYYISDENLNIVTWVESHDNYINDGNWSLMSEQQIEMAYAIISARKAGTPLLFDRPYGSAQDDQWGMNRIGASGSNMYKSNIVRAVNFFRIAMKGEEENLVKPMDKSSALVIERGKKGAVIINLSDELETGFEISLPDGTYKDRVDNKTVYTVKGGKLTGDNPIPENTVVVLYNDGYVNYAAPAVVSVEADEYNYSDETADVTLHCSNTEKGEYTLKVGDDTKEGTFEDGDEITITQDKGSTAVLTLTAVNSLNTKTYKQFFFTREGEKPSSVIEKGAKVYFVKPDDWGDKINAYVYADDGEETAWPGKPIEDEGDGKFSYTFTDEWISPRIIFNDGSKQYPAANEPGLLAEPDKTYTAE